ncbi:MAG: FapA family protein [Candidatus Cloacimonetes bacterium]|nr:FapA family protein [Candidatus Cloacimonadota bacterium]
MADSYYYNSDRSLVLSVKSNGMEAYLTIEEGIPFYNEAELLSLFKQAGIVTGFVEARELSNKKEETKHHGKPFLLAVGTTLSLPKGNFSLFQEEQMIDRDLLFSDRLQLIDLEYKAKARKNSPLATFYVTDSGRSGHDIYDNLTPLPKDKIALCHLYAGENVLYDEDSGQYVATSDGYAYLDESNRMAVCNNIQIKSDVSLTNQVPANQENFSLAVNKDYEIWGNLHVQGSINGPGSVKVKGDLFVDGRIDNCDLYVEGETQCQGKIVNTSLTSLNNIKAISAVNSRISSGNELSILTYAKQCLLTAEVSVQVVSNDSFCQDCRIYAGKLIKLQNCYKTNVGLSELIISIAPFTKELITLLTKQLKSMIKNPFNDKEKVQTTKDELSALKEHLMKRYSIIESEENKIEIIKTIVAGVYVRIINYNRVLDNGFESVEFYIDNEKLVTKSKVYIT